MIYGYARVSTKGQAKDGNSLEYQSNELKAKGAEVIYTESYTGTKFNRPELDKLLSILEEGDVVIVTKLDRVARSVSAGLEIINTIRSKGASVDILNMARFDNSPGGKMMLNMFLAIAEFERDTIVERTTAGKSVCRKNPEWRDGRPLRETPDFEKFLEKQKEGLMTVTECCKELGIARPAWYRRVKEYERQHNG